MSVPEVASARSTSGSRFGQSLFVALVGLAAGGAGSLLVSAVSTARTEPPPRIAPASDDRVREFAVERAPKARPEVRSPEPARLEAPAASAAPEQPARHEPAEETQEENARRHVEQHERAIRQHEEDPRDPSWAPAAEAHFTADLRRISEAGGFKLTKLSCKTTSCVAGVAWNSFGAATTSYTSVLHGNYQVNCSKRIILPDPKDPSVPYEASAIFDCVNERARETAAN